MKTTPGTPSQSAAEPLPTGLQLTPLDPYFREHPHAYLDRLRAEDPLHRDSELGRLFATRFEDIKSVLSGPSLSVDPRKAPADSYLRRAVVGGTPLEKFEPTMLHLDEPEHTRIRSLVSRAFNQRSVEEFRPRIREIAGMLLDSLTHRDSFDLIAEYSAPLPIMVIAEMLGVDPGDLEQFKYWSDARAQLFNTARTPEQSASLAAAEEGLNEYFARAIEACRRQRGTDLVSALVSAEEAGARLTQREIVITCNLLLVAGNITTTDLIGNGVLALLKHPDQLAKLRENPNLVPNAVEEILRYDPPVAQVSRVAIEPIVIGGTEVRPGETITVSLLAAGRDPSKHSEPHRFDIERASTNHLAFGRGAHFCIGAPLARAEAQIALPLLFERFPRLHIDPQHPIEHKAVPVFNGLRDLWVRTT
jgi:cytochrome P450